MLREFELRAELRVNRAEILIDTRQKLNSNSSMALCDDCFQEFLHPLVHELIDKNSGFDEQFGGRARWDWDSESATITFSDPEKSTIRINATVVGTTQENSWQWTWANRNFPLLLSKQDLEKIREYGEANGFDKLTSAFLDADEFTGWEMTAVAAQFDAPGAYRFPTDNGFCYIIYRKIEEVQK